MRAIVLGSILLAGCASVDERPSEQVSAMAAPIAMAQIRTPTGGDAGRATVTTDGGSVSVSVDATGLTPGNHGFHVHTVGRCDAPDFTTAGPHWNPNNMQHGTENPQGPHAGDMPNLVVGDDGRGTATFRLPSGTVDSMLDADGASIVIHANADDLRTDPSGNSGGRIACGVFQRS
jgi:Cu-Zn family superoxide dismutase